jgi:hypothetical protein
MTSEESPKPSEESPTPFADSSGRSDGAPPPSEETSAAAEKSTPTAPGPAAAKGGPSLLRIILFAVLVVAIVALAWDRLARRGAKNAYDRIKARLSTSEEGKTDAAFGQLTSCEDVKKLAGREPDEPAVAKGNELHETYTWQGAFGFRKYRVYVVYRKGPKPTLSRTTLNQPP